MKANRKFVEGEEAVSAVIGVILMVAITVAIAATVYMYVSGMIGGGTTATPSVAIQVEPDGNGATITVGTPTDANIKWQDVWFTCSNLTAKYELTYLNNLSMTWPERDSGDDLLTAGQAIYITGAGVNDGLNGNPSITCEYRFTLVYNQTSGILGQISWTQ